MSDCHDFPTPLTYVNRSFEFCIKCLAMRQCCLCLVTWKHALFISPKGIMIRSIFTLTIHIPLVCWKSVNSSSIVKCFPDVEPPVEVEQGVVSCATLLRATGSNSQAGVTKMALPFPHLKSVQQS